MEARQLREKVRVLCWVMTNPDNHQKKAMHVKQTWGKRCNVLLFMSSAEDASLPSVALPVGEGRDNLWAKTKEAFKYVWQHYRDQADWFMKADDDTYVASLMRSSTIFTCFTRLGYFSARALTF